MTIPLSASGGVLFKCTAETECSVEGTEPSCGDAPDERKTFQFVSLDGEKILMRQGKHLETIFEPVGRAMFMYSTSSSDARFRFHYGVLKSGNGAYHLTLTDYDKEGERIAHIESLGTCVGGW
ncbi:hypothetical protein [Tropicibacter sp. R16_0]|uniref:hypothetical protein n=1 Tax=Tropicibacter sp. R16_0 TaxID=2821102 RepID=UPI001ADAC034|nr:hypothetical protein [Tropicibacter sp. R16_0]